MSLAFASLLFLSCQFVKALRIYFVLGEYRIKFVFLFIFSNLGIFFSYLMDGGLVFIYEIAVVSLLLLYRLPLFSSCYTLLILRLFDSILLFTAVPLLGIDISNKFYLVIFALVVVSWLMVSTLPVIMNRLEKRILVSNFPSSASLISLRQIVIFKKQLSLLSFVRRGSIPMIIMLTCLIWGLECLSLATLHGDFVLGVNAVFSRISGSLGIVPIKPFEEYNYLVYILISVTAIVAVFFFVHSILKGQKK